MTSAVAVAATLALTAGCSTFHRQAKYNATPAPIATGQAAEPYAGSMEMGAPGAGYETQSGAASSAASMPNQPAPSGNDVIIPLEKERLQVGKQQVNNGAVRVRKTVKTETVTQPVEIRQETVTVDRLPANAAPQSSGQAANWNKPFQNGEITIPLTKEQPVVQTEVVPAGSVVIHKQQTTQPVNVQGQIRTEDVTAEPVGNPQNVTISGNLRGSGNEAAGAAPPAYGQSAGTGSSQPITQLSQLTAAPNPMALSGQQVNLSNAKVQKVYSDQLVTIAAPDGSAIFVRFGQPASGLKEGQMLNLNGTVRQVPSDTSNLGWDQSSAQALQGQQIFIEAPSFTPAGQ